MEAGLIDDAFDAPLTDAPSWYQRNSGALPKSQNGMGEVQRRSVLPKSVEPEPDSLVDRIRSLVRR